MAAANSSRILVTGASGPIGEALLPSLKARGYSITRLVRKQPSADAGIRTVQTRFGLVLSPTGGALQRMLPPFRMGVGGKIGNGRQWWSWIHVKDLVGAIHHALRSDVLRGPVNVVAPKPVRNA